MDYALKLLVCLKWVTRLVGNYERINNNGGKHVHAWYVSG